MSDDSNPVKSGSAQQSGPETAVDPSSRSAENVHATNHGENSSRHPYQSHRGHEGADETNTGDSGDPRSEAANIQPARPSGDGEDLAPREHRNSAQPEPKEAVGPAHVKKSPK